MSLSYRDEIKELDGLTRDQTGGSFLQLAGGVTHFELSNPEAAGTVVLVHGFSVPSFIFDPTFAFLTRCGLRVLRYDLFGRGLSDRPEAAYDIHFFVRQLRDLLDGLRISSPVSLVGLSMGAPIAAAFTACLPGSVNRLVLIGPAGAGTIPLARLLRLAAQSGPGERLAGLLLSVRMVQMLAASPFDREHIGEFGPRYLSQMQYRGFKRAILSTLRSRMLEPFLEVYEQVGRLHKPVLLLWGRKDRAVPVGHSRRLLAAMPDAELRVVENAGHIPHYEKPEMVNPILLQFLAQGTARNMDTT